MIRRPPRSTLFPYPPLSQSQQTRPAVAAGEVGARGILSLPRAAPACARRVSRAHARAARGSRSEEHTSELQSPCNLVCRLLLEKKKKDEKLRTTDYAPHPTN